MELCTVNNKASCADLTEESVGFTSPKLCFVREKETNRQVLCETGLIETRKKGERSRKSIALQCSAV